MVANRRDACSTRRQGDTGGTPAPLRHRDERNVPFHETNPFYFRVVFDVSILDTETYVVCSGVCKWVRSGKTNPFSRGLCGGLLPWGRRRDPSTSPAILRDTVA